ncbi:MAG: hypothetical protein GXP63_05620, partial [DPANN group archaeon]|nr:hypothetical protein [DPANN group archaeon]
VLCWGANTAGQLGNGTTYNAGSMPHPQLTNDASPYLSIAAGTGHACGIRLNDSRVLCWGNGGLGALGNGGTSNKGVPTLTSDAAGYRQLSLDDYFSCGIRLNDSRVLCWGSNLNGQLGDGTTTQRNVPTLMNNTFAVMTVVAGYQHTCIVRMNDSRLLCNGGGVSGELGDGLTTVAQNNSVFVNTTSTFFSTALLRASFVMSLQWLVSGRQKGITGPSAVLPMIMQIMAVG